MGVWSITPNRGQITNCNNTSIISLRACAVVWKFSEFVNECETLCPRLGVVELVCLMSTVCRWDSCLHGEMSRHVRARHGLDKLFARFFNAGVVDCVRSRVEHFANACVFRLGRNTECRANLMKVQARCASEEKFEDKKIRRQKQQYGPRAVWPSADHVATYFRSYIQTDTTTSSTNTVTLKGHMSVGGWVGGWVDS